MMKHPEKKWFANGDPINQLEAIENPLNNVQDMALYKKHCMDLLFPNMIYLKENKRIRI